MLESHIVHILYCVNCQESRISVVFRFKILLTPFQFWEHKFNTSMSVVYVVQGNLPFVLPFFKNISFFMSVFVDSGRKNKLFLLRNYNNCSKY